MGATVTRRPAPGHIGPVIVTKTGPPAAVLVAVPEDEGELERFVLANTPRFRRLLVSAARRVSRRGGLAHQELWGKVSKT
jgi:antitoxin (DNA-binding transcriptional repressor) of toxin-antitoxin stability system